MDWTQVLTVCVVIAINLITVIALCIRSNNKVSVLLKAIHDEMKDFDAKYTEETRSFHGRLVAIEERKKVQPVKSVNDNPHQEAFRQVLKENDALMKRLSER